MLAKSFRLANTLVYGGILVLVLLYGFVLVPKGYFEVPRLKTQDLFFQAAHALNPLPAPMKDIVIVAIDDESLAAINQKWPWEREHYAYVLEQLQHALPKVIAFDIVFLGRSANRPSDEIFAHSLRNAGDVILASYSSETGGYVRPYALFARSAAGFGMINKPRDVDSLVRSARLWMRDAATSTILDYTFETKILCHYFQMGAQELKIEPHQAIFSRTGSGTAGGEPSVDIRVPLRKDGNFPINYIARPEDFTVIPIRKVIQGQFDASALQGKIVLIGQTNEIIHDIHPTPLGQMPGVMISANVLLTILSNRFIREISPYSGGMELLLFTLITFLITWKLNLWRGAVSTMGLLAGYGFYAFFLFRNNWVGDFFSVPFFVPLIFTFLQLYRSLSLFIENLALKQDAITDGLTGLYIHKYLLVRLQNELDRALRYEQKLAVALVDLDFFKHFNDTYGHEEGNRALMHFAKILRDSFRKVDLLFRYGGEEFCIVLPGSDAKNAVESVERFRKRLSSTALRIGEKDTYLNASMGIAVVPDVPAKDIHGLLACADKALYEAKRTGRNRTCQYKEAA